ncbi:alpha/beta fold hydrolase [Actinoplanes sp. Pm04-4]|uniref:Alpha/beta fold hydrolase n=1 Tax=Paractinoplanes pyxinae TaxID=2997416 RepID=A0ABT4BBK3_9ACTN|nr:alpha/beta fold hydrolase [Actinoplanes pyxinae]MCY1143382.1 alpha/beta fold hydrolase [Actinoplanes pyxinae]
MNTIVSVKPLRLGELQVRVTAPAQSATALPVVVFSHGFGWSMDGYAPLADHWASAGFLVVQPTHLDSRTVGLAPDDPRTPLIWRSRAEDLTRILDRLDELTDRPLDHTRIAVAGHSWGAQTASMLLGAGVNGPGKPDPRVTAGVLLAVPGRGGADLSPFAVEHFDFMNPDFSTMTTPALIVAGDRDQSLLTTRGPDWFTDAFHDSPGPKTLVTLPGAEHSLGGIVGAGVAETTDEDPERVALIQRITVDFLNGKPVPGESK